MGSAASIIFDVLSLTSVLVLMVVGFAVIAGMMGIFNFAHGELVLLGALTVYLGGQNGLPTWLGILLAPVVVGLFGLVLERLVIRRFYARPIAAILATWALALMIREIVRGILGGRYVDVAAPLSGSFVVGDLRISQWRVAIIIVALVVVAACYLLLRRTGLGLQVRATLENPALARASGIPTGRLYALTFALGSALAGLAGAMVVPTLALNADLGVPFLIRSFLAVMLGGAGGFEGPVLGAGLIGVASGSLPWAVTPVLADVLIFVLAVALVKFRPGGLLSRERRAY